MKRVILFLVGLFSTIFSLATVDSLSVSKVVSKADSTFYDNAVASPTVTFEKANGAFVSGQYPMSVALYESILDKGLHSTEVYFNLGNAYFQQNQIGKAVLNYTRASYRSPFDADVAYNLELAKAKSKDKIDVVPQFFLVRWFVSIGGLLNSNWWAVLSLFFLGITALGVASWLVLSDMRWRKVGFYSGLVMLFFTICSLGFSISSSEDEYESDSAVVINVAAPIKSSPSVGGKDIFILHEGAVVKVLQDLDGYSEIELSDGNKGWIASSAIERV